MNITVNVRETSLSGTEAMTNPDTRDMCRGRCGGHTLLRSIRANTPLLEGREATARFMSERDEGRDAESAINNSQFVPP